MLRRAKNVFFIGIKGAAMANLAYILKKMGKNVEGADVAEEFITDEILKKNNINVKIGFNEQDLPETTDLIIYSAAHLGINNPLVKIGQKRGIKIIHQAQVLGELMSQYKTKIAVCGCHGKTTTSSLLAFALSNLKANPGYVVGVPKFNQYPGASCGKKDYFVIEADEYGVNPPLDKTPKFNFLNPDYIICTNIDFDHPDVYANFGETKSVFLNFFDNKKLILSADDPATIELINRLNKNQYATYGFSSNATLQIKNLKTEADKTGFEMILKGKSLGFFEISLFGEKNVSNAAAVIYLLIKLGFNLEKIRSAIRDFTGAERRFEKIAEINNTFLFDDYAHHPVEITTTINAAREKFKDRRIIIIFQPHTYSRTQALLSEFTKSLSTADYSFILPIFASAREDETKFTVTSANIVSGKNNLLAVKNSSELISKLKETIKDGDVIFTMGAGDVYKLKDKIISTIKDLRSKILDQIIKNKNITSDLTLRVKTTANNYFEANSRNDLILAKKIADKKKLPLHLLGGGSNIIFIDNQIKGLVVKNKYVKKEIVKEDKDFVYISVSSGYSVNLLVQETINAGYAGFEYFAGLPGTIGGAVYMNSKWTNPPVFFGDNLVYAYLLDQNGKVKKVDKDYFKFAYGFSILQKTKDILLEAVFKLTKVHADKLKTKAKEVIAYRTQTQPKGFTNGCFFKNSDGKSAGYLIDQAGLKGFSVGDFYVSDKHANFIINKGNGKIEDLKKLLKIIKAKVKAKFGVELEEEVILI